MTEPGDILPPEQVIEWLISGRDAHEVERAIRSTWPRVKPERLIKQAIDTFTRAATVSDIAVVGWAIEAYRDLYRQAREAGDFKHAIAALKALVALKLGNVFDQPPDDDAEE